MSLCVIICSENLQVGSNLIKQIIIINVNSKPLKVLMRYVCWTESFWVSWGQYNDSFPFKMALKLSRKKCYKFVFPCKFVLLLFSIFFNKHRAKSFILERWKTEREKRRIHIWGLLLVKWIQAEVCIYIPYYLYRYILTCTINDVWWEGLGIVIFFRCYSLLTNL